jgi:putative phage-type endonuclease
VTEDRNTYIGGADAAAVAGVGLWASPYSVWARKVGAETEEREQTERMRWGLVLERPLALEWARREGIPARSVKRSGFFRMADRPYVGGHPDFLADHPVDGPIVIETKLSDRASEWEGEEGDNIPLQYFLQVQHYLLISGRQVAYLVVLLRGNELRSWRIPRDEEVIGGLLEAYDDFWALVESRTPPEVDGHEATAETLKRRYPRERDEEIVADLPEQALVESLIETKRVLKLEEARKTEIENRLKERMKTAARLLAPGVVISWRQNKPSVVTDWESVAKGYRAVLSEIVDEFPEADFAVRKRLGGNVDTFESIHTNTIPGARPFRVTISKEEE